MENYPSNRSTNSPTNPIPTNNPLRNRYRRKITGISLKMNQKRSLCMRRNREISMPVDFRKRIFRNRRGMIATAPPSMICPRSSLKFRRRMLSRKCPKMYRLRKILSRGLKMIRTCRLPNQSSYRVPIWTTLKYRAN